MDLRGYFYCSTVLHIAWYRSTKIKRKKGRKKERKEKKSTPSRPDQRQTQYGLKIVLRRKEL